MAIFSLSGKIPDEKERLKRTDRLFAIQSLANFIIFIGMLLGPIALLQLKSDILSNFFICAWSNGKRLTAQVFQKMIKRFIS